MTGAGLPFSSSGLKTKLAGRPLRKGPAVRGFRRLSPAARIPSEKSVVPLSSSGVKTKIDGRPLRKGPAVRGFRRHG